MNAITFDDAKKILAAHPAKTTPDIVACLKDKGTHAFTETTFNKGVEMGIDWAVTLKLPQKQVKRATQFINAITEGTSTGFDKSHARLLIAMREAGQYALCSDALITLAANARKGDVNTRGVTLGSINAKFKGHHGISTVSAKKSNSMGKNGFMTLNKMVICDNTINNAITMNSAHPAIHRFFDVIDNMSEGQLLAILGSGDEA